MSPADLARRLYLDQCRPNDLSAYGERAAVTAMVPLIEALEQLVEAFTNPEAGEVFRRLAVVDASAALTPQPEDVA